MLPPDQRFDRLWSPLYSRTGVCLRHSIHWCLHQMAKAAADLETLESRINELITLCEQLAHENGALRAQQTTWTTERAKLIEKNELAKSKVESMISRLKSLEQDS